MKRWLPAVLFTVGILQAQAPVGGPAGIGGGGGSGGGGGGGSSAACGIIAASPTTWTFASTASTSPCNFNTGNKTYTVVSPITITLTNSVSDTIIFGFDLAVGRLQVHSGTATVTCPGACDVNSATSQGQDEVPLATSTVSGGSSLTTTPTIPTAGTNIVRAGTLLIPTYNNGILKLDVNAAGLPPGPTGPAGPPGAPGYGGTSTTTVTLGAGLITVTTQAGYAYNATSRIRLTNAGSGFYCEGLYASYSGTTLAFTCDNVVGAGTFSSWILGLAGDRGPTGATGATGAVGPVGPTALTPGPLASRPGTCSVGALYQATDLSPFLQLYMCTSTNTWSLVPGFQTDFIAPAFTTVGAFSALTAANKIKVMGIIIDKPLLVSQVAVRVSTADAVNNYDFGLYSIDGSTLVWSVGPTTLGSGTQNFSFVGGSTTIAPGRYVFAFTGNSTTGILVGYVGGCSTFLNGTEAVTTSSGGTLPASITVPALAENMTGTCPLFHLH